MAGSNILPYTANLPQAIGEGPQADALEALRSGSREALQRALAEGADVNHQKYDASRMSLLHYAVNLDKPELVDALLQWGADPNIETIRGITPLFLALGVSRTTSAELLLDYGADPSHYDKSGTMRRGSTPLHKQAERFQTNAVELLLKAGSDPLLLDGEDKTPIGKVSGEGQFSLAPSVMMSALESHAALPRVPEDAPLTKAALFEKNAKGFCPLDNPVTWRQWSQVVERLVEAGEELPSKQELMQEGRKGLPYLARAAEAHSVDSLVGGLNRRGESLRPADLKAHPETAKLLDSRHVARAVLREGNVNGWGGAGVRQAHSQFSEKAQTGVHNLFQLVQRASHLEGQRGGVGR